MICKLRRPLYGLKTAPAQWQDFFAGVLTNIGVRHLKSEPNVYYFTGTGNYVLVYVDDIVAPGLFDLIQQRVLLQCTGELVEGATVPFLGRRLLC